MAIKKTPQTKSTGTPGKIKRALLLARNERISELAKLFVEYNPGTKALAVKEKLIEALDFAAPISSEQKNAVNLNERLSDPLDVIEHLIKLEEADLDTLLATILYTDLMPKGRALVNQERMNEIKEKFGPRVKFIVQDTISLWSLSRLPTEEQNQKENARDFTLMALLCARSRPAIMIRGAQSYDNIKDLDPGMNRAEQATALTRIKLIADLAYIAQCPDLRRVMLNQSFRIRDPRRYDAIGKHIGTTRVITAEGKIAREKAQNGKDEGPEKRVKLTPDEIQVAIQKFLTFLNTTPLAGHYTLGGRQKDIYSFDEKTAKKNKSPDQIGDTHGLCIIINNGYIDDKFGRPEDRVEKATKKGKSLQSPEQNASEIVYDKLAREFGRRSNDPVLKSLFEELILRDPDDKDPTKDARYDNYYANPKASGYRGIQDTFFVVVNNKVVEFEIQIQDEKSYHFNNSGDPNNDQVDPSHRLYKTGMSAHVPIVKSWDRCRDILLDTRGDRVRVPYVSVYGRDNEILIVKGTPEGCVGSDFIRQHFAAIQKSFPEITSQDDIVGIRVDSDNPTIIRDKHEPISPAARLRSGDRIKGFVLKSQEGGPV